MVGWDRRVDYEKLCRASLLVQRGAVLFATNADASYPAADGNWPGAGALLAAVETTTGARAEVFGKPEAPIMLAALERAGGGTPLVIGDRLETDIAGAAGLGWDSLLVLTGITQARATSPGPRSCRRSSATISPRCSRRRRPEGASGAGGMLAAQPHATEGDPR